MTEAEKLERTLRVLARAMGALKAIEEKERLPPEVMLRVREIIAEYDLVNADLKEKRMT